MSSPRRPCKIRLLDEVSCAIVGLHGDHLQFLHKQYAVPAANYFFNPRYKLGAWDGKINYFKENGRTYVFLLEEILPILMRFGYAPVIEDMRTAIGFQPDPIDENIFSHIMHLDTGEPTILRDYQVRAVNALIEHSFGLINASTGAGKTLITAAMCYAYGKEGMRTLTIVPSQDLIRQTKAELINCQLDTGEYSGARKTLDHQHIVSTWHALKNNPAIISTFGMIFVDEVHQAKNAELQKILIDHAAKIPYRFGVTGTIPKEPSDQLLIKIALGPVRETITAVELMKRGVLAQIAIDVVQLEENLTAEYDQFCKADMPGSTPPTYIQFKDGYFPDFASEKSYIHRKAERIEWIADLMLAKQDAAKGNILCFVDSISLGRSIASLIPGALFVNGVDMKTPKQRLKVYDLFKDRDDLIVIATVHIAGTGLNIRRIKELIGVDLGKSFTRVIQAIGRGARTAHDKTTFNYTDVCSDLKYGKRHLATRISFYKEAQYPFKKRKIDYAQQLEDNRE